MQLTLLRSMRLHCALFSLPRWVLEFTAIDQNFFFNDNSRHGILEFCFFFCKKVFYLSFPDHQKRLRNVFLTPVVGTYSTKSLLLSFLVVLLRPQGVPAQYMVYGTHHMNVALADCVSRGPRSVY